MHYMPTRSDTSPMCTQAWYTLSMTVPDCLRQDRKGRYADPGQECSKECGFSHADFGTATAHEARCAGPQALGDTTEVDQAGPGFINVKLL